MLRHLLFSSFIPAAMKSLSILLIITILSDLTFAQHTTAASTGTLPPSLSYDAVMALPSPTKGSLVLDNTNNIPRVYNGSKWVPLLTSYELTTTAWKAGSSIAGYGDDSGNSIAVDANGNVYVTGYFRNTATFGSTTLTAASGGNSFGAADIFIAKYNSSGALVWVQKAGGLGEDAANSITTDAAGNIYVTGSFSGTATFGPATVISAGEVDVFIAKYSSSGTLLWIRRAGGSRHDYSNDIAVAANGNIYILGNFVQSATFGTTTLTTASTSSYATFIAKYDNNGSFQWAQKAEGGGESSGIAVDGNNDIYISGKFQSSVTFGTITLSGTWRGFLAKCNDSGVFQWAYRLGNSVYDVCVDVNGDIYAISNINGSEPVTFGTTHLSAENTDMLIIKYKSNGNVIWTQRNAAPGGSLGARIATDAAGNFYVTGTYSGPFVSFNATTKLIPLVYEGNQLFVAKYSGGGLFQWVRQAGRSRSSGSGGGGDPVPKALAVHANRTVYITGVFTGEIMFDSFPMEVYAYNVANIFVMKTVD